MRNRIALCQETLFLDCFTPIQERSKGFSDTEDLKQPQEKPCHEKVSRNYIFPI